MSRSSIRNPQSAIRNHVGWPVFLLTCAVLAGLSPVLADDTPVPASQPAKGELDPAYIDGSFGFSVRPPAGCTLFKEKQVADADVEIARFINLGFQWSFTVRLTTTSRPLDAKTTIDGITAELSRQKEYADFKAIKGGPARIASRDGVRYEASFKTKAEGAEWLRQQAVVPFQQNDYFVLVFITPLADREMAEPVFDRIMGSFQILRDERTRGRIQAALARGTALLRQAAEGRIDVTAKVIEDNYVRCLQGGEEIGFVRISERLTSMNRRKGIQIREWGWLFNPDGSTSHLEHDMFLSTDLAFERWENRVYVIPAGKVDSIQQVVVDMDNAIREEDQLGIAYLPKPNAHEKRDKVISVEKSYASAAWMGLFPRLVDLSKPETYAFSCYESQRRGMILRTLEVAGPARVLIDGQQVAAFKIEDSEGLIPPKSEIFVDKSGRLLRLVADRLEMVTTSGKYIEQRFGKKVTAAQDLLRRLEPPAPAPAPGAPPAVRSGLPGARPVPPSGRSGPPGARGGSSGAGR